MKPLRIVWFLLYYLKEILMSNFRVVKTALMLRPQFQDGVIKFEVDIENPVQLALLGNLLTMTPGTIFVDYDEMTKLLSVHLMFLDEKTDLIQKIHTIYIPFVKEIA